MTRIETMTAALESLRAAEEAHAKAAHEKKVGAIEGFPSSGKDAGELIAAEKAAFEAFMVAADAVRVARLEAQK